MKDANQSIYHLTAREAAAIGLPHDEVFIDTLKAIRGRKLQARFDGVFSPAHPYAGQQSLNYLVEQAISALERNPNFFVGWFRMISVDPSDFRRWRNRNQDRSMSAATERRPRSSPKKVEIAVGEFVARESKAGRNVSQKGLWEWAKAAIPSATNKQVLAAMTKAEGGRKPRGRPRKSLRQIG